LILDAIVALHEQSGATTAESTTAVAEAPGTTAGAAGSLFVDVLVETLSTFGVTVDDAQKACLVENAADLNPSDLEASIAVVQGCGIDVSDLG